MVILASAAVLHADVPLPAAANSSRSANIDDVTGAWKARQERIRSLRVKWTEIRTDFKGAYLDWKTRTFWPEKDTRYRSESRLIIKGRRSRYVFDGKGWFSAGEAPRHLAPRKYTVAFDGRVLRSMKEKVPQSHSYTDGIIHKHKRNVDLATTHVRPLTWFCRPLEPDMGGWSDDALELTAETSVVDGRSCLVVGVRKDRGSPIRWKLWVDPHRGFTIQRAYRFQRDGRTVDQYEVSYRDDPKHGWLPKRWRFVDFSSAKAKRMQIEMIGEVEKVVVNPDVQNREFVIEFPPGTWVNDLRGGNLHGGEEKQYIVRAEKPDREVLPSEVGASYEQLVDTDPGRAFSPRDAGWSPAKVYLTVAAGLLAIITATWFVRSRLQAH